MSTNRRRRTRGTSRAPSSKTGRRATLRLALDGDLIEAHLAASPQKILGASLDSSEFCTLSALCPFGLGRSESVGDLDFRPTVRVAGYSEFCIRSFRNSCRLNRHAFQQCWEILYAWHVGGDGALTVDLQDEAQHAARFTT